jgi:phosphohistidine phosphatase
LEHAYPTKLKGWLVVVLKRHAEALHALRPEEFAELALIQARATKLLYEVLDCEKEYTMCLAEAEHFHHVHVHIVPRARDLPAELIGTKIFALLGDKVADEALSPDEVKAFCEALRDQFNLPEARLDRLSSCLPGAGVEGGRSVMKTGVYTKTLLILRHAKSSWKDEGVADYDRPLKKRGKRDAPRMGALLRQERLVPDFVITSSAKRAQATTALAVEACGYVGEVYITRDLYQADMLTYFDVLREVDDAYHRVMVVGHNPGLETFLDALTGVGEPMPTAALAYVKLPINTWQDLNEGTLGELVNLWRPRDL